jgi:hypothetical protein
VLKDDMPVSAKLRLASRVLNSRTEEVCWRRSDIVEVFQQLANKSVVILGFDILTLHDEDDSVQIWGTSAYDMDECLHTKSWNECVKIAFDAARSAVEHTLELTNYAGDVEDLFYSPVIIKWGQPPITE